MCNERTRTRSSSCLCGWPPKLRLPLFTRTQRAFLGLCGLLVRPLHQLAAL